ncbi:MAG: hypothetical protein ISN29_12800, partial [Gammaproteobacteria bacterium AqS3]|nr:hypothetical protein [Gammaproteobacteria bacterium AqS3]
KLVLIWSIQQETAQQKFAAAKVSLSQAATSRSALRDWQRDSGYAACPDNSVEANYPLDQNNAAVTLVFADKLAPGLRSVPTRLTVNEGETGQFSIRLTTSPEKNTNDPDVTVTIAQPSLSSGVVIDTDSSTNGNQNTLTFTGDNWHTGQTVYVSTAKDSDYTDARLTLSLSASGGGSDDDYSYAGVSGSISLTVRDTDDDDRPYVTYDRKALRENSGDELEVRVHPNWGAFDSAPTALSITDVKGSVRWEVSNPDNTGAGSQNGTAANTSLPTLIGAGGNPHHYLIKFTAEDDSDTANTDDAGAKFAIVSGTGSSAVSQEFDLRFKVYDNDEGAPAAIVVSSERVELVEGQTANLTIRLGGRPEHGSGIGITISGVSSDEDVATFEFPDGGNNKSNITTNWADSGGHVANLQITAVADDDSSVPREATITLTTTPQIGNVYPGVTQTITVVVNKAPAGFNPSAPARISATEGSVVARSIALRRRPDTAVTVALASTNSDVTFASDAAGNTAITELSFTTSNWNTAQTFYTVLGTDADTDNDSATVTLTASGGIFADVSTRYAVSIVDTSSPAVVPSRSPVVLDENGRMARVGVRLSEAVSCCSGSQVSADFDVTSSDTSVFTVSPSSLRFDPNNNNGKGWNNDQILTITPVNDSTFTSTIKNATINIAIDATPGLATNYDGLALTIPVQIRDDEPPPLVLSSTSLTVDEGDDKEFTVRLQSRPLTNVTVVLAKASTFSDDVSFDTDAGTTGDQDTLTFTTDNWSTAQTVTVSAAEDDGGDNDTATINLTAAGSGYASTAGSVSVTVDDDEGFELSVDSLTVAEADEATFTVRLTSEPSDDVTVTLAQPSASANSDVTIDTDTGTDGDQNELTFTTTNWNVTQTVTVRAADDGDAINDMATINVTAEDGGYDSVEDSLTVSVTDDNSIALVVSETSLEMIKEGESTTFTVALDSEPTSSVTVTLTQPADDVPANDDVTFDTDGDDSNGNQPALTFTTGNWSTAQTVTV